MKLIPIETRDIPPEAKGRRESLPQRIYEAALISFMDGRCEAVRVEEPRITKNLCYRGLSTTIERLGFPCKAMIRDGNVYLIKTI